MFIPYGCRPEVASSRHYGMTDDADRHILLQIVPRASTSARPAAPPGLMRVEDHPDRVSPFHWPTAQPSPDSPGTHNIGPHTHVHRHILHHHRPHAASAVQRQHASESSPSGTRRTTGLTSFGAQPSNVSLSSILQQSESGPIKMEGFHSQSSFTGQRTSEPFSAFQGSQRPLNSFSHHMYGRPANQPSHSDSRMHGKEHEMAGFGRSKDGAGIAEGSQSSLHPPISLRPVGRGYS